MYSSKEIIYIITDENPEETEGYLWWLINRGYLTEDCTFIGVTIDETNRIFIYTDANPESTVCVFTVPKNGLIDYAIRIKMQKTGKVTVVADVDGKLYSASKTVKVTIGGCGG